MRRVTIGFLIVALVELTAPAAAAEDDPPIEPTEVEMVEVWNAATQDYDCLMRVSGLAISSGWLIVWYVTPAGHLVSTKRALVGATTFTLAIAAVQSCTDIRSVYEELYNHKRTLCAVGNWIRFPSARNWRC